MGAVRKPWWQQATALVTVSTGGVITGFSFVPGAAATMTSPSSVPVHLLALEQAAQPGSRAGGADAASGVSGDTQLRSAIVNVAGYYLQLARTRTAAQLEALIWDKTSSDGTDHGESCAAFASLTLELAAQTVGQQSWVTGGSTYPWPLHPWADVRVDTNPASPAVTSLVADAQAHARWHAVGDGYRPQPGDWVVFDEHVEVVTSDAGGVLHTIGADSLPGLTVNAHSITGPPAEAGVAGFVDNGHLQAAGSALAAPSPGEPSAGTSAKTAPSAGDTPEAHPKAAATPPEPAVPGLLATADQLGQETGTAAAPKRAAGSGSAASVPGLTAGTSAGKGTAAATGSAVIPGSMATPAARPAAAPAKPARAPAAPAAAPSAQPAAPTASAPGRQYATPGTRDQQAFISLVAPGAVAAQQRYGVPAAVTIAQAIEESAWGSSGLAADYHNLFGIKGTGPAGSVSLPTSEYEGGQWVTVDAGFRVYHNDAESIADHAELLATSGYYSRAMADRAVPDAFANDLTGVYATDPNYGANLVALMKLYNLYRFDTSGSADAAPAAPVKTAAPAAAPAPAPATAPAARKTAAPAAPAPSGHQTARPRRPAAAARPAAGAAVSGTAARARVPGAAAPVLAPSVTSGTTRAGVAGQSGPARSRIPGLVTPGRLATGATTTALRGTPGRGNARMTAAGPTGPVVTTAALRYKAELPSAVTTAFFASAKAPLARGEHLYRDVAACAGISWELLAAVDWLECKADPRRSPVHGERLGSVNSDGTSYATKSQGLLQCAADLAELAAAVYGIDLAVRRRQSVRALAAAFAAFRWGAILQRQHVSAMEFPYSVAGLTAHHQKMHWPGIDAPDAPDRPGSRFREPFGAVPVVLALGYPATV